MRQAILKIWICWLIVILLLAASIWILLRFPTPGGSADTLTLDGLLGFSAHIGIFGTIKMLAVILLPPVVLTYIAWIRARRTRDLFR